MWHQKPDAIGQAPAAPGTTPPSWRHFLLALKSGLRLSLLRKPDARRAGLTMASFWQSVVVLAAWYAVLDYLSTDPPRQFSAAGFEALASHCLLLLLACYLPLRAMGREALLWPLATLLNYGSLLPSAAYVAVWIQFSRNSDDDYAPLWIAYAFTAAWWAAMFWRALSGLQAGRPGVNRVLMSGLAAVALYLCSWLIPSGDFWQTDYQSLYASRPHQQPLFAEDVLPAQPELLTTALNRMAPGTKGKPSLYFIAFAPYARQGVFAKEARYTAHLFEHDFGARDRTLTLINNPASTATVPLASVSNLRLALQQLGRKMIPDQDILFLYLTSHGSRDAELSVDLPGIGLHALDAKDLSRMLDAAGIRWRVIVVSSCYSGSFIPELRNDDTLLITAARADRTSFGCSDEADFTYFGQAYFQQALHRTRSFVGAFGIARELINQWESEKHYPHADPQIDQGKLIQAQLEQWLAGLPPRADSAASPAVATAGAGGDRKAGMVAGPPATRGSE